MKSNSSKWLEIHERELRTFGKGPLFATVNNSMYPEVEEHLCFKPALPPGEALRRSKVCNTKIPTLIKLKIEIECALQHALDLLQKRRIDLDASNEAIAKFNSRLERHNQLIQRWKALASYQRVAAAEADRLAHNLKCQLLELKEDQYYAQLSVSSLSKSSSSDLSNHPWIWWGDGSQYGGVGCYWWKSCEAENVRLFQCSKETAIAAAFATRVGLYVRDAHLGSIAKQREVDAFIDAEREKANCAIELAEKVASELDIKSRILLSNVILEVNETQREYDAYATKERTASDKVVKIVKLIDSYKMKERSSRINIDMEPSVDENVLKRQKLSRLMKIKAANTQIASLKEKYKILESNRLEILVELSEVQTRLAKAQMGRASTVAMIAKIACDNAVSLANAHVISASVINAANIARPGRERANKLVATGKVSCVIAEICKKNAIEQHSQDLHKKATEDEKEHIEWLKANSDSLEEIRSIEKKEQKRLKIVSKKAAILYTREQETGRALASAESDLIECVRDADSSRERSKEEIKFAITKQEDAVKTARESIANAADCTEKYLSKQKELSDITKLIDELFESAKPFTDKVKNAESVLLEARVKLKSVADDIVLIENEIEGKKRQLEDLKAEALQTGITFQGVVKDIQLDTLNNKKMHKMMRKMQKLQRKIEKDTKVKVSKVEEQKRIQDDVDVSVQNVAVLSEDAHVNTREWRRAKKRKEHLLIEESRLKSLSVSLKNVANEWKNKVKEASGFTKRVKHAANVESRDWTESVRRSEQAIIEIKESMEEGCTDANEIANAEKKASAIAMEIGEKRKKLERDIRMSKNKVFESKMRISETNDLLARIKITKSRLEAQRDTLEAAKYLANREVVKDRAKRFLETKQTELVTIKQEVLNMKKEETIAKVELQRLVAKRKKNGSDKQKKPPPEFGRREIEEFTKLEIKRLEEQKEADESNWKRTCENLHMWTELESKIVEEVKHYKIRLKVWDAEIEVSRVNNGIAQGKLDSYISDESTFDIHCRLKHAEEQIPLFAAELKNTVQWYNQENTLFENAIDRAINQGLPSRIIEMIRGSGTSQGMPGDASFAYTKEKLASFDRIIQTLKGVITERENMLKLVRLKVQRKVLEDEEHLRKIKIIGDAAIALRKREESKLHKVKMEHQLAKTFLEKANLVVNEMRDIVILRKNEEIKSNENVISADNTLLESIANRDEHMTEMKVSQKRRDDTFVRRKAKATRDIQNEYKKRIKKLKKEEQQKFTRKEMAILGQQSDSNSEEALAEQKERKNIHTKQLKGMISDLNKEMKLQQRKKCAVIDSQLVSLFAANIEKETEQLGKLNENILILSKKKRQMVEIFESFVKRRTQSEYDVQEKENTLLRNAKDKLSNATKAMSVFEQNRTYLEAACQIQKYFRGWRGRKRGKAAMSEGKRIQNNIMKQKDLDKVGSSLFTKDDVQQLPLENVKEHYLRLQRLVAEGLAELESTEIRRANILCDIAVIPGLNHLKNRMICARSERDEAVVLHEASIARVEFLTDLWRKSKLSKHVHEKKLDYWRSIESDRNEKLRRAKLVCNSQKVELIEPLEIDEDAEAKRNKELDEMEDKKRKKKEDEEKKRALGRAAALFAVKASKDRERAKTAAKIKEAEDNRLAQRHELEKTPTGVLQLLQDDLNFVREIILDVSKRDAQYNSELLLLSTPAKKKEAEITYRKYKSDKVDVLKKKLLEMGIFQSVNNAAKRAAKDIECLNRLFTGSRRAGSKDDTQISSTSVDQLSLKDSKISQEKNEQNKDDLDNAFHLFSDIQEYLYGKASRQSNKRKLAATAIQKIVRGFMFRVKDHRNALSTAIKSLRKSQYSKAVIMPLRIELLRLNKTTPVVWKYMDPWVTSKEGGSDVVDFAAFIRGLKLCGVIATKNQFRRLWLALDPTMDISGIELLSWDNFRRHINLGIFDRYADSNETIFPKIQQKRMMRHLRRCLILDRPDLQIDYGHYLMKSSISRENFERDIQKVFEASLYIASTSDSNNRRSYTPLTTDKSIRSLKLGHAKHSSFKRHMNDNFGSTSSCGEESERTLSDGGYNTSGDENKFNSDCGYTSSGGDENKSNSGYSIRSIRSHVNIGSLKYRKKKGNRHQKMETFAIRGDVALCDSSIRLPTALTEEGVEEMPEFPDAFHRQKRVKIAMLEGQVYAVKHLLQDRTGCAAGGTEMILDRFSGTKPVHVAASKGHIDVLDVLVNQLHAKLTSPDTSGRQTIHYAAENGHLETIRWLVDAGVAVDASDYNGQTGLHIAALNGHFHIVYWLISHRQSKSGILWVKYLWQTDFNRWTILHFAAFGGHKTVALLLFGLPDYAQVHSLMFSTNNDDKNCAEVALEYGHNDFAQMCINVSKMWERGGQFTDTIELNFSEKDLNNLKLKNDPRFLEDDTDKSSELISTPCNDLRIQNSSGSQTSRSLIEVYNKKEPNSKDIKSNITHSRQNTPSGIIHKVKSFHSNISRPSTSYSDLYILDDDQQSRPNTTYTDLFSSDCSSDDDEILTVNKYTALDSTEKFQQRPDTSRKSILPINTHKQVIENTKNQLSKNYRNSKSKEAHTILPLLKASDSLTREKKFHRSFIYNNSKGKPKSKTKKRNNNRTKFGTDSISTPPYIQKASASLSPKHRLSTSLSPKRRRMHKKDPLTSSLSPRRKPRKLKKKNMDWFDQKEKESESIDSIPVAAKLRVARLLKRNT